VFDGVYKILNEFFYAYYLAVFKNKPNNYFLSFFIKFNVDFPIANKVIKRSTIGLPLALPGYFPETK
jgi:hypothetical protein